MNAKKIKNRIYKISNRIRAKLKSGKPLRLKSPLGLFRKHRTPVLIGLISITVLYVVYSAFIRSKRSEEGVPRLSPEVRTVTVRREHLKHEIETPGTITYFEKAAVNSRVPGRVERLYADQGQSVRKGQRLAQMETFELRIKLRQVLASLNSAGAQRALQEARYANARRNVEKQLNAIERMQADILSARADFINARRDLLNKKEIHDLGGVSEVELKSVYARYVSSMSRYYQARKDYQTGIVGFRNADLTKAGLTLPADPSKKRLLLVDFNTEVERNELRAARAAQRSAGLELQNIRLLLKESKIVSPLKGVVASRNIEAGEEVKTGEPLFTIVRMDKLLVSTNMAADQLRFINTGRTVRFRVDALGDEFFSGKVYLISPVIDVKTRTAELRIETGNEKRLLRPGMFARCRILTREKKNGIALPEGAFRNRREEKGRSLAEVFVIREGLAFRRTVELGEDYQDRKEVLAGLKPGEAVAVTNVRTLKDGGAVRVLKKRSAKKRATGKSGLKTAEDGRGEESGKANDEGKREGAKKGRPQRGAPG